MFKIISFIYFKCTGWQIKGHLPAGLKKCVIIAAPHTSMMDFVIGRLGFYRIGLKKVSFLIKKELFKFPIGLLLKAFGGIPVDRGKKNNTITLISKMFVEKQDLLLLIAPEGTRKLVKNWKKGFYHIAVNVNVPIVLSFIDYKKKEAGIGSVLYPTGNYENDLKFIEDYYRNITAKYPENFNLSAENRTCMPITIDKLE